MSKSANLLMQLLAKSSGPAGGFSASNDLAREQIADTRIGAAALQTPESLRSNELQRLITEAPGFRQDYYPPELPVSDPYYVGQEVTENGSETLKAAFIAAALRRLKAGEQ